jgi:hypothetical protein
MRHARALQVRMLYVGRLQKERHFTFERGNPTQLEESLFMPPTIRMIVGLWEGLDTEHSTAGKQKGKSWWRARLPEL